MPYANKILQCDERKYSPYWAAISVCDGIKKKNFKLNDKAMSFSEVEIPVSIIDKMNMGQCYQLAKLTTTIMKSCGIPVALDYTPQWPNRSGNHTWNALKDGKGKIVPFIGADTYPGAVGKSQDDMPKVYRYTYAYQANSVWALGKKYNESIPPTLGSPFIRDVSTEYFNGTNINVEVKKTQTQKHIIYLSVYNNQQWIPVTGSELTEEGTVSFANMGRNILYLPVYWGRNGSIPCGNPVYISPSGEKKHFIPNNNKPISVTLTRKYPILGRMYDYAKAMVGGKLEASNTPDFKEAHTLYEITDIPNIWWNEYSLNKNHTEYRYYRFSAPYNCKCNIAEIKFYDTNGNMIEYIPICDDYARNKDRVKNINDNKYLSYYESIHFMKAWAGGDMKTPVAIDKISIMPRNDDNHVVSGHIYKLEYFSDGSLVTVGIKKAPNDSITFNNIPSEALMILHDLTAGTEERLFCIENGNTHWF